MHSFLEQFDLNLKTCLSRILQCSLPSDPWCQATLPFRLGGLGLHSSCQTAAAAFLGSCNSIHLLASHLLSLDFHDLTFPDEDIAVAVFEEFSSDPSVSVASQHDLQAVLDDYQYEQLLVSSSIRERARLTALSHSSGTSGGWFKAIPQVSLGLSIPGPEFIVSFRLWLGISLFPLSPLCVP